MSHGDPLDNTVVLMLPDAMPAPIVLLVMFVENNDHEVLKMML